MRQLEQDRLYVGLKFTSFDFAADGEIVAIREEANEVDVRVTDTQGHARVEKNWNLENVKDSFKKGVFIPIDPEKEKVNISVI